MPKQRFTTEEIIHKLREADVLSGQGRTVAEVCKQLGGGPTRLTFAGAKVTAVCGLIRPSG